MYATQHRRMTRLTIISLLFILFTLTALLPQSSAAQSGQRCFAETGFCISGPIRVYWERNGGLAIFGYPISDLHTETVEGTWTGPVQWFERDRLEDHGAEGVLAGRLGARYLELTNSPWQWFPQVQQAPQGGCQIFTPTGHSLCEPYLSYWRNNGGLERFGYPVTQPIYETVEGKKYPVQYFERRRMEVHPELPGSPILLGLLGRAVFVETPLPLASYPECLDNALPNLRNVQIGKPLGCPVLAALPDVPAATQLFERGIMIWTDTRTPPQPRLSPYVPAIFALINPGPSMQSYDDTWTEGQPDTPAVAAPGGLYAPFRGFGTAWADHPDLQRAIGWATEPQAQSRRAEIQLFTNVLLVRMKETGVVYAFGNTNTLTTAQIIAP